MSTNMSSKFISQIKEFGINPSKIHRNLSVEKLLEAATQKNEGMITSTGSLSVKTGKYTGRSPDDRFIVFDDLTHDKVHWAKVNKQIPTETFEKLSQKMKKFVDGKELYIFDGFVGADPENRLPIRVINDHAWQSLFVHQLLIRPSATELESHEPEFTIICINDFEAIKRIHSYKFVKKACFDWGNKLCWRNKKSNFFSNEFYLTIKRSFSYALFC